MMNMAFRQFLSHFVVVFLNDILVYSSSTKEQAYHLRVVLQTLRKYRLYAKFNKYKFWIEEVHFLVT